MFSFSEGVFRWRDRPIISRPTSRLWPWPVFNAAWPLRSLAIKRLLRQIGALASFRKLAAFEAFPQWFALAGGKPIHEILCELPQFVAVELAILVVVVAHRPLDEPIG
jgi:hypothetical protein